MVPAAIVQQAKIEAEVRAVEAVLRPDIVRIRYEIGEDWSGQWAIFFRVVLSDDAAKHRLREVATNVERRLAERLDFQRKWRGRSVWRLPMICSRTPTILPAVGERIQGSPAFGARYRRRTMRCSTC
jgi:hypothetical protein